MNYNEELKKQILNTEGYLMAQWSNDSTPFSDLASSAEEYIMTNTLEGKVTALFIYHQLSIEILKMLIIYSNFYEKLCVYPAYKEFKLIKDDASFSEIIQELKCKVEFKSKKKLTEQILELNKLRNKFGHKLIAEWWGHDQEQDLKGINKKFSNIYSTFIICLNDIREMISNAKQRSNILELINNYGT